MELDIPGTQDPYSATQWIRIRFQNTGKIPDPHDLNQEKKARLTDNKTSLSNSYTQCYSRYNQAIILFKVPVPVLPLFSLSASQQTPVFEKGLDLAIQQGGVWKFFWIVHNRSTNQRSGTILEVQIQNFGGACVSKFFIFKTFQGA